MWEYFASIAVSFSFRLPPSPLSLVQDTLTRQPFTTLATASTFAFRRGMDFSEMFSFQYPSPQSSSSVRPDTGMRSSSSQGVCRFFRTCDTPNSLPLGYCAEVPSARHAYPSPIWSPYSVRPKPKLRPATFDGPPHPSPILREASAFSGSRSPSPVEFLPSPLSESPHERAVASPDQNTQTFPTAATGKHSTSSVDDDVTDEELYGDHTLDEELYGSAQPKAPIAELGDLDDDPRFGPAPVAPAATSTVLAYLPGLFATPPSSPSARRSSSPRLIAPKAQYPFPQWAGQVSKARFSHSEFPTYAIRRHRPVCPHPDYPVPVQYEGDLPGFGTEDEPYVCDTPSPVPYPEFQYRCSCQYGASTPCRCSTSPSTHIGSAHAPMPYRDRTPSVRAPTPPAPQTQDRRLSLGYILGAERPRDDEERFEKLRSSVESSSSPDDFTGSMLGAKRRREYDDDEEDQGPECKKTRSA
ncbi:hypothetical protein CYLTODRAFT_420301 [Cylindrobasidium torrendii FP15055 ss-10]|uniref:Uncharacterized protein n=1 Tax=Cylindrobasidium torrendii FP15055 ss-10 TaxID=1314674 RepID=A0A0D7BIF5_9AGAR|nr:hypothetical protein CYLTODRAFT_420301 [Cylindrobasidium torrendii FP15055 ss-10]